MIDIKNYEFAKDQGIDFEERYARDVARLEIREWANFRWAIHIGHHTAAKPVLQGEGLSEEVIDCYRDMGKAHYQAVTQLAQAHLCLDHARNFFGYVDPLNYTLFFKSVSEFYFHIGASLDALSRLIYILSFKDSVSEKQEFEGEHVALRKRMNFYMLSRRGQLQSELSTSGFNWLVQDEGLRRIVNIRDLLTHGYKITMRDWKWPEEAETTRWIAWPHGEEQSEKYLYVHQIPQKMQYHFDAFVSVFNKAFRQLTEKIRQWEERNHVNIV